jgi:hypothetical protein
VLLHRAGLPAPELHPAVSDAAGSSLGTVAFGYREQRVLGEFDGPGGPTPQLRDRDERLRDAGWQVHRWTFSDLYSPAELVTRLAAALRIPTPSGPASVLGDGDLDLGGI